MHLSGKLGFQRQIRDDSWLVHLIRHEICPGVLDCDEASPAHLSMCQPSQSRASTLSR